MPQLIDPETPAAAKTRTGYDGQAYELVFSDEFNTDGRTFYPGDDPFWEAADIWYGSTADQEWYDPKQIYTKGGALQIVMDSVTDTSINHGLPYRSGMLQSWNKFCFTSGYIEVAITLPGPDSNTKGYVSSRVEGRLCAAVEAYHIYSGPARGRWGTLAVRDTGQRRMGRGRIREPRRQFLPLSVVLTSARTDQIRFVRSGHIPKPDPQGSLRTRGSTSLGCLKGKV